MERADYLGSRALKGAMAFVLAVGLCPVAPAIAQEGVTANEEGGAESSSVEVPADDAVTSIDGDGTAENDAAQPESVEIIAEDAAPQAPGQLSAEDVLVGEPETSNDGDGTSSDGLEASDGGSIVDKGSCGQGVTYKIYDSGLMTIDGSGDVSFSGTKPPYSAAAKDVKVVIVDEGITSFCGFAFSGLKKCQAIFFKGNFVSGYGKYFKKEQYAFSA